ncbi:hypothetical protein G7Z17_g1605 [Cylindrodendrum hubeiense]|uniref:Uncharacterized protein n=1 Tax=Cylindrodendrum hubeiense TaxID=595255 RepID=A0A9P5LF87_9HYPO|nr:hypothetical protein G7Z17_g1605 [Cylindrodendrum hubeiense]
MRLQRTISAAAAIPVNLPPHVALGFLHTYIPTLTKVPDLVEFHEIPSDPASISDDPFFGPWDETVRTYMSRGAIRIAPGLTKVTEWPSVFQSTFDGIRLVTRFRFRGHIQHHI